MLINCETGIEATPEEIWANWRKQLLIAQGKGYDYLAHRLQPPPDANWRQVNEAAHALEEGMSELDALLKF